MKIMAETVGQLQWERSMMQDWYNAAKLPPGPNGQTWKNPIDYSQQWRKIPENDMQNFVNKAEDKYRSIIKGVTVTPSTAGQKIDFNYVPGKPLVPVREGQ
jgi:hypothetical protein